MGEPIPLVGFRHYWDVSVNSFYNIPLTQLVRDKGVEPIPLAGLDPKSSASANSANLAKK